MPTHTQKGGELGGRKNIECRGLFALGVFFFE